MEKVEHSPAGSTLPLPLHCDRTGLTGTQYAVKPAGCHRIPVGKCRFAPIAVSESVRTSLHRIGHVCPSESLRRAAAPVYDWQRSSPEP